MRLSWSQHLAAARSVELTSRDQTGTALALMGVALLILLQVFFSPLRFWMHRIQILRSQPLSGNARHSFEKSSTTNLSVCGAQQVSFP